jgi:hypothetical protein
MTPHFTTIFPRGNPQNKILTSKYVKLDNQEDDGKLLISQARYRKNVEKSFMTSLGVKWKTGGVFKTICKYFLWTTVTVNPTNLISFKAERI